MTTTSPAYLRIRKAITDNIHSGHWPVQHRLPGERELSELFSCTRITLREALSQLEAERLIYRLNRKGWFVAPPPLVYRPSQGTNFLRMAREANREAGTETLFVEKQQGGGEVAAYFGESVHLARRRSLDGRPVLLEFIHLNSELMPDLLNNSLDLSLTTIMSDYYDIQIRREQTRVFSTAFSADQAAWLGVVPGRPGVMIERVRFDQHDRPVEVDQELWCHDAIEIRVDADC